MWSALLPWGTLDSMGHMHEVLTGDFYHQQVESVPEQTWSSAEFVSAAVHGLLGLEREAAANHLTFAPHLPPSWSQVTVAHVPMRSATVAFKLARVGAGLDLDIENDGEPFDLTFSPEIPLGARLLEAEIDGKATAVTRDDHAQMCMRL